MADEAFCGNLSVFLYRVQWDDDDDDWDEIICSDPIRFETAKSMSGV